MSGNERKQSILIYVTSCLDNEGYSPTYREIAEAVGLRSTSSVSRYIEQLKEEGKLTELDNMKYRTVGAARQISLPHRRESCNKRVQLITEKGGYVCFDCSVQKDENSEVSVTFSGILDASELTSPIGRIVQCTSIKE